MSEHTEPFGRIGGDMDADTAFLDFYAAIVATGPLEGWTFDGTLGETVFYARPDRRLFVYCTPDWEAVTGQCDPGYISIFVVDDKGNEHDEESIPWPLGPDRTAARYRELVAPILRKHATSGTIDSTKEPAR